MDRCPLKLENELKSEGRGAMDFSVSSEGILILKWFNNKEVTVASNHYSANPVSQVKFAFFIYFIRGVGMQLTFTFTGTSTVFTKKKISQMVQYNNVYTVPIFGGGGRHK
jgi:hypothetical protein